MSLKYMDSVILVGGAPLQADVIACVRDCAGIFVAADGGADAVLALGVIPDAVIGDMDSLSDVGRAAIPDARLYEVTEQDSTDFDKAVRTIDAPLIYAVGFSGGRLDHELAALHVLARYADRPIVVVGAHDVTVHLPARIALDLPAGMRVSLFPLDAVTVGIEGLRWSFEALALHPLRQIGTSNEARGGAVVLTSDAPGVLLIMPRAALDMVVEGLRGADLHSPKG